MKSLGILWIILKKNDQISDVCKLGAFEVHNYMNLLIEQISEFLVKEVDQLIQTAECSSIEKVYVAMSRFLATISKMLV